MNYLEAKQLYSKCRDKSKGYRLPGRNGATRLVKMGDDSFGIQLYNTIVVGIHPDGSYTLNSGGWNSSTTKDRINLYSPVRINQRDYVWYVNDTTLFKDGMKVKG